MPIRGPSDRRPRCPLHDDHGDGDQHHVGKPEHQDRDQGLGFLVGEVVLDPGEEGGPGGAGVGYRPVGTRCFNSSNQLRMTMICGLRSAGSNNLLSAPSY